MVSPMDQEKLKAVLERVEKLPTLPQVSQRALSAIDKDASARELEKIIVEDQTLAAKLLKLANSPLYAPPQPITSLRSAIVRLGFGEVRNVVLATALNYLLRPKATYQEFDLARLWIHAVGVARAAFLLAREEGHEDPESLYTAGLLHDIGRLTLAVFFPEEFLRILALQEARGYSFWEAEQETGFLHTEVGGLVAAHWRFSSALVNAIRLHHRPHATGEVDPVAFYIFRADIAARAAGFPAEEEGFSRLPRWPKELPLDKKLLSRVVLSLKKEREDLLASWHDILAT